MNIFTTNLIFITFQQFNIFLNYHHTSNINVIKYKYLYIILLCVFVLWLLKILWVYILWWCYSTHKQQNIFIIFIILIISLHHQTEFTLNYSDVIWTSIIIDIRYNISWIQQYPSLSFIKTSSFSTILMNIFIFCFHFMIYMIWIQDNDVISDGYVKQCYFMIFLIHFHFILWYLVIHQYLFYYQHILLLQYIFMNIW